MSAEGKIRRAELDALRQRLLDVRTKIRERDKLRLSLRKAEATLASEAARLATLKARLEKEHADLEKLDRLSLAGLFYAILGTKDERRKKEREEYVTAKLRYDECRQSVQALEKEAQELRGRAARLTGLDAEYQSLLAEKEKALAEAPGDAAAGLVALAEEQAELAADAKELQEAVGAGRAALRALDLVVKHLRSAGNWGTWDLLGGGILSTAVKHSKMDGARRAAHAAQIHLRRFQRELADVSERFDLKIEIGGFATFADYFFDGLIVDWYVQKKITQALNSALRAAGEVRRVVARVEQQAEQVRSGLAAVEDRKRKLIEEA